MQATFVTFIYLSNLFFLNSDRASFPYSDKSSFVQLPYELAPEVFYNNLYIHNPERNSNIQLSDFQF
jgi:hypothetical protein